jgi:hypothetical protein
MNYFRMLNADDYPSLLDQFFARYPEGSADVRAAIERAGKKALIRASKDLAPALRVAGATGFSEYSLAACGRVLCELTRPIDNDAVATSVCAFAFGQAIESKFADQLLWAARWFEMGMPNVCITAQQAAALSLTDVDPEISASLHAPWPAFSITFEGEAFPVVLSDDVLPEAPEATGKRWCRRVAVTRYRGTGIEAAGRRIRGEPHWQVRLDVDSINLWSGPETAVELCRKTSHPWVPNDSGVISPSELEERAVSLGKQLAVNVILAMETHGISRAKGGGGKRSLKGKFGLRGCNGYVLGSPVKVNAVPAMHAYLEGTVSKAFKVRWVVRGHWRNQACGIGYAARARKWIEPYWKGREDAPVIVRDHEL